MARRSKSSCRTRATTTSWAIRRTCAGSPAGDDALRSPLCEEWQRAGFANTPLAIYHGSISASRAPRWCPTSRTRPSCSEGRMTVEELEVAARAQQRDRRDPPGAGGAQMSWRPEVPPDFAGEGNKIKWRAVPYVRGLGLDIGCGPWKAVPALDRPGRRAVHRQRTTAGRTW
jgi:hypothetical protein